HVERPKLGKPVVTLTKNGVYSGNTAKGRAAVSAYRYPELVNPPPLAGPEQVFAVRLTKAPANFGVRVLSDEKGGNVTPRVVRDGGENRPRGVRRPAGGPRPLRADPGPRGARGGRDSPRRGDVRRRLRHAEPRVRRQVHVQALDQRPRPAVGEG